MGLGGTAKKLQKVVDVADELYARINDLKDDITAVRNSIDETNQRVSNIEDELSEQRELLERIAEAGGVDVAVGDEATQGVDENTQTDEVQGDVDDSTENVDEEPET